MSDEILVNVTPDETRVAVIESGMVQELYIERGSHNSVVGNIYRGRVSRVLPGMDAAFVDIGLARTAFLHAADVHRVGAQEGLEPQSAPPIAELLRDGQDITVQVVKDPIGTKGARLTTQISVPSRHLVLLPGTDSIGVSVRIEEEAERERLRRQVAEAMPDGSGVGYIVRTNADRIDPDALRGDMQYLGKVWDLVERKLSAAQPGQCVYEDLSLELRALRDLMHAGVEKVRVDNQQVFARMHDFADRFIPGWVDRLENYRGDRPIFDVYGVEDAIQRALERTTPLKSGGYLSIDQTEAMTTIDVNTGGFVGHRSLEETSLKTNLEAAQAIARELRLRNLGGIIIIDFIDMEDEEHRHQVVRTLERALAGDSARTNITEISQLGLVEMTRKRTTDSLINYLCEPCPQCSGRGLVKTADTVCFEVFREIMRSVRQFEAEQLLVVASPAVVDKLLDDHSVAVAELEESLNKTIRFQAENNYNQEQFDVVLL